LEEFENRLNAEVDWAESAEYFDENNTFLPQIGKRLHSFLAFPCKKLFEC